MIQHFGTTFFKKLLLFSKTTDLSKEFLLSFHRLLQLNLGALKVGFDLILFLLELRPLNRTMKPLFAFTTTTSARRTISTFGIHYTHFVI
jgi:hypothetical protein